MTIRLGRQDISLVGPVRVYICGITPYDTTHVGHAATFVWSDVAVRFLRLLGHEVRVARNITDVDDGLLRRAEADGASWRSLATQQTYRFEDDMARLGVSTPTVEPQAHNFVDEVIQLAQALLDRDQAYEVGGTVYSQHDGVHDSAGLSVDEAMVLAAERGEDPDDPSKQDPLDTVVWQGIGDDDPGPGWDSPWGRGRPGWHAECAAMALATLGPGLDLHCGDADLAYPHHAFETAHAEAATGVTPFARAWLRAGTVHLDGAKMAKSTGNLVLLDDLLGRCSPAALRLIICDRRWWDEWELVEGDIAHAEDRVRALRAAAGPGHDAAHDEVIAALSDDLDVPTALGIAEGAGGRAAEAVLTVLGLHHTEPTRRTSILPSP
ncbi:class I tRNA ligase family protein [Iamia majanohamensis]|uniref:Class I tRNA ligase family protein n=1 Tax=Iamia majanohamensis TaxID=467976 RepID=A0AAE9Y692_9ACTN|nr:class I tRNA ligase family protein [Iamia majanohamensis]WCO66331.1 class I tRNA ligase family protein [Iamia majanohamensis]